MKYLVSYSIYMGDRWRHTVHAHMYRVADEPLTQKLTELWVVDILDQAKRNWSGIKREYISITNITPLKDEL